jgi:hypothetical protein
MGYADSVSQILLRRGDAEARAALERGDIWAGLAQQLGQVPGQVVQGVRQERDDQQRRADQEQRRELQQQQIASNKALEQDRLADVAGKQELTKQDAALRDYFAKLGDADPDIKTVSAIVGPKRGVEIAEGMVAFRGLQRKEYDDKQVKMRDVLAGFGASTDAQREAAYPHIRQEFISAGLMKPEDAPETYDPAWYQQRVDYGKAQVKAGTREIKTRNADGSETIRIVKDEPTATPFESAAPVKPPVNHMVTVPGPNGQPIQRLATEDELKAGVPAYRAPVVGPRDAPSWILRDGVALKVSDAQLKPGDKPYAVAGAGAKAPTGAQNKTLGFFNRAKQAADDLETVETEISQKGLGGQAWMAAMPNALQGQAAQTYQQAQRAFTEARLRKDSGAAIPDQEFDNDRKTYFVQPGDTPATLAQKTRARSAMLASLAFEAGPALHGFYGDEAEGLIAGYKAAAKPAAPASTQGAGPKVGEVRTAHGETRRWSGTEWVKQ